MWAERSCFYHIYPFGMCGDKGFGKIYEAIEQMKYFGADAVYLGPVFESVNHGYDTTDYFKIDRRLGDEEAFKNLCQTFHQNGIKIVLDGVFNHVGREFWAFLDVKHQREASPYVDWFRINWQSNNRYDDGFAYEAWEGCEDLIKLNLRNDEVKKHLLEAVKFWITDYGIDGLRLDVAYCLDKGFIKELRQHTNSLKADFWLMGEVLRGDYNRYMKSELLDSVTNYECYKGLYSSFNDKNMFEIAHSLQRQNNLYAGKMLYNFVDNHDVERIATILKDKRDLELLYTLLFAMPGIPSIYYGSEFGIEGSKKRHGDSAVRPYIENFAQNSLTDYLKSLNELRKTHLALANGTYRQLALTNETLVFMRENAAERVLCGINLGEIEFKYSGEENELVLAPKSAKIMPLN